MSIAEEVYRLFCVPRCPSCKSFLKRGERVLCEDCMKAFLGETVRDCSFCFHKITECTCTPRTFKKSKIRHLFKVSRYYANLEDSPTKKLIFSLKKDNLRKVVEFIAEELAKILKRFYGDSVSEIVIVPIPRRKANVIKFGYDHAYVLSKRVAKILGCKTIRVLQSLTKKDQKGLSREERRDNVKYRLRENISLNGLQVVILDDIVTTGSSMMQAAKLIGALSPKQIDGACFAISYKDIQLNANIPF